MGGLGFAMTLKRQWGFEDFVIFERGPDVGGTWRSNTTQGCASDIPMHWYSYTDELRPNWKKSHGLQPVILDYIHDITEKYALRPHCRFETAVTSAEWDVAASVWRVTTQDINTGATRETTAKILISAIGPLCEPNISIIKGAEDYKGTVFHSARWRHDVELHGKRVGVIGNGCSAVQFVPIISGDLTTHVVEFCRTPMWFTHVPISSTMQWIFAHVPFVMRTYRNIIMAMADIQFIMFRGTDSIFSRYMRRQLTQLLKDRTPAKYHDKLIPSYAPGCKRIIRDNGYLKSLHRSNIELNWDGIDSVTPEGIRTKTGEEHQFDVLIYATGFVTDTYPIHVKGTQQTLVEYYDSQGGPTAYLGATAPGFPNFVTIQGPNTTTGHASVIFTEETQFNYTLQLIAPVLSGALASFEPTLPATETYNAWLQRRLTDSVWMTCTSWYRRGQEGKIFSTFPGPLALYWWFLRAPQWADYVVKGDGSRAWGRRR
ncbi:FAD/NAD-P-binding domain-containing protein, partial [Artomyces pyxidatus]